MGTLEVRLKNHIGYQRWDWGSPLSLSPVAPSGSARPREVGLPPPSLIFYLPSFPCLLWVQSECLRGGDTLRNGMAMQTAALALGTLSGTDAPGPASAR